MKEFIECLTMVELCGRCEIKLSLQKHSISWGWGGGSGASHSFSFFFAAKIFLFTYKKVNYQRVASPSPPLRRAEAWPLPQHSKQRYIPSFLPLYNSNYTRTNLTCHIFPICYNFSFSFNIFCYKIWHSSLLLLYSCMPSTGYIHVLFS